jgi:hypothetical protein
MKDLFCSVTLPYPNQGEIVSNPSFETRYLRAIELALREAWHELMDHKSQAEEIATAQEERITQMLREMLQELWANGRVAGYNPSIFERPHVGAEFPALHATKLKKPDIVFGLCGNPRPGTGNGLYDHIFVECKLVDYPRPTVATYCADGLQRFVNGSYAWTMREAMMIAYVRNKDVLPIALDNEFSKISQQEALNIKAGLRRCTITRDKPPVYVSIHDRPWSYPETRGIPGPVEIRHLWLNV